MKTRSRTVRPKSKLKKRPVAKTKKSIKPLEQEQSEIDLKLAAKDVNHRMKSVATELRAMGGKATRKAVSIVKLVGVGYKLKEQNNHLQGLYAELGKMVYDQRMNKSATTKRPPAGMTLLMERISEMKKKIEQLEREAEELKKTT